MVVVVGRLDQKMPGPIFCPSPALAETMSTGCSKETDHAEATPIQPMGQDQENQMNPLHNLTCVATCNLNTPCWFRLARGKQAPQLSLVSPKVFSPFMSWNFGSLPLACLVVDAWLIAQTLLKESWTGWWHHWIINELTLKEKMTLCYYTLALLTNYFPVWNCKAALTQSVLYKALYK